MSNDNAAAFHLVHRATRGLNLFETDQDYWAYLDLLRHGLKRADCRLGAWSLLPDRVEFVAIPAQPESLTRLMKFVDARYAGYCNIRFDRTGVVWAGKPRVQALMAGFELLTMLHTETGSGIKPAEDYPWCSAGSHVMGNDALGLLDLEFSGRFGEAAAWSALLESYLMVPRSKSVAA